jgi:hypothetical protein
MNLLVRVKGRFDPFLTPFRPAYILYEKIQMWGHRADQVEAQGMDENGPQVEALFLSSLQKIGLGNLGVE